MLKKSSHFLFLLRPWIRQLTQEMLDPGRTLEISYHWYGLYIRYLEWNCSKAAVDHAVAAIGAADGDHIKQVSSYALAVAKRRAHAPAWLTYWA